MLQRVKHWSRGTFGGGPATTGSGVEASEPARRDLRATGRNARHDSGAAEPLLRLRPDDGLAPLSSEAEVVEALASANPPVSSCAMIRQISGTAGLANTKVVCSSTRLWDRTWSPCLQAKGSLS